MVKNNNSFPLSLINCSKFLSDYCIFVKKCRPSFRWLTLLLLVFVLFDAAYGQELKVKVSVDSLNYSIGDHINLKYEINHPKDVIILFPNLKDSIKSLDLVEQKPTKFEELKGKNSQITIYSFVFAGFDSGDVSIPSIIIPYKHKGDTVVSFISTDSLSLTVHTVAVDTSAEIKDIKEPLTIPYNPTTLLIVLLILIVVAVILYLLYKRYKRLRQKNVVDLQIIKLPHEIALESLESLNAKRLWQSGEVKKYHSEITEIIRQYFESRFRLPALEMTTSEVLSLLAKEKETNKIVDLTRDFLNNADMVKFAKYIPMNSINEEMMEQAKKIVSETIPEEKIDIKTISQEAKGEANV